jgi:hypothetical protein
LNTESHVERACGQFRIEPIGKRVVKANEIQNEKAVDRGEQLLAREAPSDPAEHGRHREHRKKGDGHELGQIRDTALDRHLAAHGAQDVIAAQQAEEIRERPREGRSFGGFDLEEGTKHQGSTGRLGGEAGKRPPGVHACVVDAVVQPTASSLPEFEGMGGDAIASPMRRTREGLGGCGVHRAKLFF